MSTTLVLEDGADTYDRTESTGQHWRQYRQQANNVPPVGAVVVDRGVLFPLRAWTVAEHGRQLTVPGGTYVWVRLEPATLQLIVNGRTVDVWEVKA